MTLSTILNPISEEEFFSNYWNKSPLVIAGNEGKFSNFPDSSKLPAMCVGRLEKSIWSHTPNLVAQASTVNRNGRVVQLNNIPISMFAQLFNSGFSLCFSDISHADSCLRELVEEVSNISKLRSSIVMTCYLSPPNSTGILHYDHQHVLFLQRQGVKCWRIAKRPAIRNPIENFVYLDVTQKYLDEMSKKGYSIAIPQECGFQDIVLKEGDLLYMPPGYYHVAHTDDKMSFHYTLTLEAASVWKMLMKAVHTELLRNSADYNDDLRALSDEKRKKFIEEQLQIFQDSINSLSIDELD